MPFLIWVSLLIIYSVSLQWILWIKIENPVIFRIIANTVGFVAYGFDTIDASSSLAMAAKSLRAFLFAISTCKIC